MSASYSVVAELTKNRPWQVVLTTTDKNFAQTIHEQCKAGGERCRLEVTGEDEEPAKKAKRR